MKMKSKPWVQYAMVLHHGKIEFKYTVIINQIMFVWPVYLTLSVKNLFAMFCACKKVINDFHVISKELHNLQNI